MKRLYLIMLVAGSLTASAQGNSTTKDAKRLVAFGLKFGFNKSNVYDGNGKDFVASPNTGLAGGAFVSLPIGGLLGIQPELLLSQKGFRGTCTLFGETYSMTRTTTHLDVPFQLQFKPLRFLYLLGGIQYSYLLSQTDKFTFGNNSSQQKEEFANANLRKNVVGLVLGADAHVMHFTFSVRGALDLQDNHGDGGSSVPRYKNMWLQFTAGYRFY